MKGKKLLGVILAISLVISLFTGIPFTASAAGYDGTTYTFETYQWNFWSGTLFPVDNMNWSVESDDSLQFAPPSWSSDLNTIQPTVSITDWGCAVQGLEAGKEYKLDVICKMPCDPGFSIDVYSTLLNGGRADSHNIAYDIKLGSLDANTTEWKNITANVTVPSDYATAGTSNFGITLKPSQYGWCDSNTLKVQLKSVTITPVSDVPEPKSDFMEVDFSNYQNKSMNENSVMMPTAWSSWQNVAEEDGNTYISVTKDKTETEASGEGTNTIPNGLQVVVNEKAAASYYDDQTPIADSYILKEGTKYFINLRYKLQFTDGEGGTLPVKMMRSGYHNTSVASLGDTGIDNTNKRLEESDEWKTVTFAATYSQAGWETWNSFGLSFYEDAVKDRKFELCLDNVIVDTVNNYPELGDANADAEIDLLDLIRMKKHLADESVEITAADLDANGVIDAFDMAQLRQLLLGVKKN